MKYGKMEIVYDNDRPRLGYSLGTVYDINEYGCFRLYNVGYCPAIQDFYFNRDIHLPKKIIEYCEKWDYSPNIEQEMIELGIYKIYDVSKLVNDYENAIAQSEIIKEKILKLNRTLKRKKQEDLKNSLLFWYF